MGELRAIFARAVADVQPSIYAHFVQERGWTHAELTERTVTGLLRELVA